MIIIIFLLLALTWIAVLTLSGIIVEEVAPAGLIYLLFGLGFAITFFLFNWTARIVT